MGIRTCGSVLPTMSYDITQLTVGENSPLQLQVVVDTEEEFDWFAMPDRAARGVSHFTELPRLQALCERYGITPCYVIDHPVATSELSIEVLKPWVHQSRCVLGAHLHPWVNPPYSESLNFSNMYPGNLPEAEEYAKLAELKSAIDSAFNINVSAYKSGRYGFGPNTAKVLARLGFDIDLSFSPGFDMTADGGPDHRSIPVNPFLIGPQGQQILSLPGTGAVIGCCPQLHDWGRRHERFKVPGILSRLNVADRIKLSPEGFTSAEHIKLTRDLIAKGVRLFSFTLHSSSMKPGCSPYANNTADVDDILDRCERYFDYFFNTLKGSPVTPFDVKAQISI